MRSSDPKRTKCREGCASQEPQRERSDKARLPRRLRNRYQIRTAQQRELSNTPKLPRSLPDRYQNSDPTRTKCREGCASQDQNWHRATKRAIRHARTYETCGFHPLLCRGLRSTKPATKDEPEATSPDIPASQTLCEPAQSKCTWTTRNGTFMREFTGKMQGPRERERERETERERERERDRERQRERERDRERETERERERERESERASERASAVP